jgi:hypothetical protein
MRKFGNQIYMKIELCYLFTIRMPLCKKTSRDGAKCDKEVEKDGYCSYHAEEQKRFARLPGMLMDMKGAPPPTVEEKTNK